MTVIFACTGLNPNEAPRAPFSDISAAWLMERIEADQAQGEWPVRALFSIYQDLEHLRYALDEALAHKPPDLTPRFVGTRRPRHRKLRQELKAHQSRAVQLQGVIAVALEQGCSVCWS